MPDFQDDRLLDKLNLFRAAIGIAGAMATFTAAAYPALEWGGLGIAIVAVGILFAVFLGLSRYYQNNADPAASTTNDTGEPTEADTAEPIEADTVDVAASGTVNPGA